MKQWLYTLLDMAVLMLLLWCLYWLDLTDKPETIDFAMVFAISALHQQHGKVSK